MAETEHKTTIKIDGDSKGATAAIDKVSSLLKGKLMSSLLAVRTVMSTISRALGVFWLAWNGIQLVIAGWQKLRDAMTATARAAERFALDVALDRATRAADRLLGKQREINAEIAKRARLEAAARQAEETKQGAQSSLESARREVERETRLAGVTDPRQRRALQERLDAEDAARRAEDDDARNSKKLAQMWSEHALQKQLAESARERVNEIDREIRLQEIELRNLQEMKAKDDEMAATKEKSIEGRRKNIEALQKERSESAAAAEAAIEAAKTAKDTAEALAEAMKSSRLAASERALAANVKQTAAWAETDREDRRGQEEMERQIAETKKRIGGGEPVESGDAARLAELQRRENEALIRLESAQRALAAELYRDVRQRSEERMDRAKAAAEEAQRDAIAAFEERRELEASLTERNAAQRRDNADFTDSLAANEAESAWRRHFATLSDEEKVKALDQREDSARERMASAQRDLSEEMEKDVEQRSEERMQRAKDTIISSQREALDAASQREDLERGIEERRESEAKSRADDLAATFQSRGNRLTAMGLGDGSGASSRTVEDINGKLTSVLDVLRSELDELRKPKAEHTARFGA